MIETRYIPSKVVEMPLDNGRLDRLMEIREVTSDSLGTQLQTACRDYVQLRFASPLLHEELEAARQDTGRSELSSIPGVVRREARDDERRIAFYLPSDVYTAMLGFTLVDRTKYRTSDIAPADLCRTAIDIYTDRHRMDPNYPALLIRARRQSARVVDSLIAINLTAW